MRTANRRIDRQALITQQRTLTMRFTFSALALGLLTSTFAAAQAPDGTDRARPASDSRVMLDYAQFDPLVSTPVIPTALQAAHDIDLFIVQFESTPTDADRAAVVNAGGTIKGYLPHDCHIVHMDGGLALLELPEVRWVGPYEPAYRLEPFLLTEHHNGVASPVRDYNMVMVDKRNDKKALANKVLAIGGKIVNQHIGGLLFTATLTGPLLLQAARFN